MNDPQPSRQQIMKPALEKYQSTLMRMEEQFRAALPAQIPSQKFVRVALTAVQINPRILLCEERSIFTALLRCANDGNLPDGREAAITEGFGNGIAVYMPMREGILKKARNSGEIANWTTDIVYENDFFDYERGDNAHLSHKSPLSNRGAMIAVYSICHLINGQISREVMIKEEVEFIRDKYSASWKAFKAGKIKSNMWNDNPGEAWRKTVIKRHAKSLPVSAEVISMLEYDNAIEKNGPEPRRGRPPRQVTFSGGEGGIPGVNSVVNGNGNDSSDEGKEPAEKENVDQPSLESPLREPGDDSEQWA